MNLFLLLNWFSFGFTLSLLAFCFFWWRALKGDFNKEEVVFLVWSGAFLYFLGGKIFSWFGGSGGESWLYFWIRPGFSWLGAYLLFSLWLVFWTRWKGWRFWLVVEAGVFPFLGMLLGVGLARLLMGASLMLLVSVFGLLLLVLLLLWLAGRYRSFAWYKSGKVGFLYLVANILYFISAFIFLLWREGWENWRAWAHLFAFFVFVIALVYLSDTCRKKKVSLSQE